MLRKINRYLSIERCFIITILFLSIVFRFTNYLDRLNFSIDQGRDAIIGYYSLVNHKLPLLGPPSSSWGFNFGPSYYYAISLFNLIIPSIYSPWIGFTLLSVLSVFLAYKIGLYAKNIIFGLLFSSIVAVSFGEIANSTNLLNTALVSFAVFLSFFGISGFEKTQKKIYLCLTGLGIALAFQSHLQALPLLLLFLFPFLSSSGIKKKIINISIIGSGFFVLMIPLLVFELQHNFAWVKSLIDYATFGQYRFYVPIRWLTDITVFWPERFGYTLWGNSQFGVFAMFFTGVGLIYSALRKKLDRVSVLVILVFIAEVFTIRNYRGPRSPEYLIFTQFFICYLFSCAVDAFINNSRMLLISLISCILVLGFYTSLPLINSKTHSGPTIKIYKDIAESGQKYHVKVFPESFENAYSLYYLLWRADLIDEEGKIIAICDKLETYRTKKSGCPEDQALSSSERFVVVDLSKDINYQEKIDMESVNPEKLYKRTYNNYEIIDY